MSKGSITLVLHHFQRDGVLVDTQLKLIQLSRVDRLFQHYGVLRLGEELRPILPYLRYLLAVDPGTITNRGQGRGMASVSWR
jgi:hypothetical protein